MTNNSQHSHLVFDGECGMCTRAALWLSRQAGGSNITLLPSQNAGPLERFAITAGEAEHTVFFITPDGHKLQGAAAVTAALDVARSTRIFTRLYRFPGCGQLLERGYRWVAANRYRFKGVTPWCTRHPEQCPESTGASGCTIPGS
ncbi:DUF393 domain-containing protein [Leucobacter sp. OH2974_COT-288]|nr:DUF393 domain-containing protein [Leucobacter sp. OH2974_COT-288]